MAKLGRKPLRERIYITLSVGLLTLLIIIFVPAYPTTTYLVNPGKRVKVNSSDLDPNRLAPNQIIELEEPERPAEFDSRRSLFDSLYYQSEVRRVNLHHPGLSWAIAFGISLATTAVTWLVVTLIYNRLEKPFAD